MKNDKRVTMWGAMAVVGMSLAACSSARPVEVEGEITAPASVAGPIQLEFFEVDGEERVSVHKAELAELGAFRETVEVSGDVVVVLALADADGDGACTEGEAWGEIDATVADDDTVEPVAIALTTDACPAPAATTEEE
jgi:hypothetical protein